jgi:hypothetical protein
MTENTFTALDADGDGQSKRTVVLAAGVAGALALGAAGYFLVLGGGSSDDAAATAPIMKRNPISRSVAKAPAKAVAKPLAKVPQVSTVRLGRDPFKALYVVPAAAPAAAPTTAPATTTTGTTTTPGTTTGTKSYPLTLVKVTSDPGGAKLFTFSVDGVSKTVLPAQRFGKYGELVVLTYTKNSKGAVSGAVVQVGDDNPVELPIGGKISVL